MNHQSFKDGSAVNRLCNQRNIGKATNCVLEPGHADPHTDGEIQWSDSLDSNYDIAAREASKPYSPAPAWVGLAADEQAMQDRFLEKCKPFLPGVMVWTDFGIGRIKRVVNVTDQYCPFEVSCSDGQTRMFKRENLTLSKHQEPIADEVTQVGWKAPAPAIGCTMQCEKGNGAKRCLLTVGHTGEHDFGSSSMLGASHASIGFDGYISFTIADDVFWACPECGAITKQPALHSKWHKEQRKDRKHNDATGYYERHSRQRNY